MLAKSIWWKGWLIWWYRIKGGSPENRSKPLEYHKKSYFRSWSFIFADYPERKFDCTLTSKFSMKLQWNLSWRGCKINFRTSRFWNCHWFWNLMFISWRNLCLENVYLTCERGNYTSVVPIRLISSVCTYVLMKVFRKEFKKILSRTTSTIQTSFHLRHSTPVEANRNCWFNLILYVKL